MLVTMSKKTIKIWKKKYNLTKDINIKPQTVNFATFEENYFVSSMFRNSEHFFLKIVQ